MIDSLRIHRFATWASLAMIACVTAAGCMTDEERLPEDDDTGDVLDDVTDDVTDEGEPAPLPALVPPDDPADVITVEAPAQFRHPGVLMNGAQLDFVRAKVKAGAQPWKTAYDRLKRSRYASLSWTPRPRATVNCGSRSNPNEGCSDEREDAVAAYTHALVWYIDRDRAHATKAIAILDAWARAIQTHTGHNAPLQTGWSGSVFPLAGEILRYSGAGWDAAGIQRFTAALRRAYLPTVEKGNEGANGNWELIMTEATLNIAVFLDDKAAFDRGVALWRRRVPAYVYLSKDGAYPLAAGTKHNTRAKIVKYWQGQSTFKDGLAQETCRDLGHTQWGIGAAIAGAETAYQQGVNLYQERADRLVAGMEFHATYMNGARAPSWLCGGQIQNADIPTWEIGYNHLHGRLGKSMPQSERFIREKERTNSLPVNYFIAWETLTHAGVGTTGL